MTPKNPPKVRPNVAKARRQHAAAKLTGPPEDDGIITARTVLATLPAWMRAYFPR